MNKINSVFIAPLNIPINYTYSVEDLTKKYKGEADGITDKDVILGIFDPNIHEIFLGNDTPDRNEIRTLMHECVEAMNDVCELNLDNHTKVVALENAITGFIIENQDLVKRIQEVLGKKKERKTRRGTKNKNLQGSKRV